MVAFCDVLLFFCGKTLLFGFFVTYFVRLYFVFSLCVISQLDVATLNEIVIFIIKSVFMQ